MRRRKYKALVVDFDNTLVGRDFKISQRLERGIQRIRKKGVAFSVATGRPYFGIVRKMCRELGLSYPQVTYGGAEIYDPQTDEALWGEYIPAQETRKVIDFFKSKDLFFVVQEKNTIYAEDCYKLKQSKFKMPGLKLKELRDLEVAAVPKIIVVASVAQLTKFTAEEIEEELNDTYNDLHVVKIKSYEGRYGIDVTSAKASKHLAVLELSKLLDINPEEIVGVGDSYNDYPLLTACGVKVAMGDAPRELKEIADFIAPSQREGGLMEVIERFF